MSLRALDATDWLAINTVRCLGIDAIEQAQSGHPGIVLGAAPMSYVLWANHLCFSNSWPTWPNRDRFVLSAGHGSMLLYALLHVFGYPLSLQDLQQFRQLHALTPGHPEFNPALGIEATTGPLGQGFANAVGMAMAERYQASLINMPQINLIDHFTYALVSDGDLMEGIGYEAASLAGHLQLGKLIVLYDANHISLDGPLSLSFGEDVAARFTAMGWQVLQIADADRDIAGIDQALQQAKNEMSRPSLLIANTTIGFGAPTKQGTAKAHGSPLGKQEMMATKQALHWPTEQSFWVPEQVREHTQMLTAAKQRQAQRWQAQLESLAQCHPEKYALWQQIQNHALQVPWDQLVAACGGDSTEPAATRQCLGKGLAVVAEHLPHLLVGDADLSSSTMTKLHHHVSFTAQTPHGRNIHFGVREHAMAAIANGMAYHGGLRVVVATFLAFSDYMRPAMRLAALSHLPVIYVFSHDSILLGEDGPTHQPVEQLCAMRCMPNLWVWRVADGYETACALEAALQRHSGPTAIVVSRQKIPTLPAAQASMPLVAAARGAYLVWESHLEPTEVLLLSTGSEVHLAIRAALALEQLGIATQVISMPCWEAFSAQSLAYQQHLLPKAVKLRVAIEAGVTLGWERYVGDHGAVVGIDSFGASAPAEQLYDYFGFTTERVVAQVQRLRQSAEQSIG